MTFNSRLLGGICASVAFISLPANAAPVIPSDYMIAGNVGDTWTYENLDSSQFTWTLSEVTSGPYTGYMERGNNDSGMVYELVNNVLTIHEWNKMPADTWGFVLSEIELGQVVTLTDDPINPSMYLHWDIPSITVQAGTYNDVIANVWLDDNFSENAANTFLGLDSSITTAAVTDISYYARGIGLVAVVGIDASTGLSDGTGVELISTTVVPVPAAVWLFGSGLLGLIGVARRKERV